MFCRQVTGQMTLRDSRTTGNAIESRGSNLLASPPISRGECEFLYGMLSRIHSVRAPCPADLHHDRRGGGPASLVRAGIRAPPRLIQDLVIVDYQVQFSCSSGSTTICFHRCIPATGVHL